MDIFASKTPSITEVIFMSKLLGEGKTFSLNFRIGNSTSKPILEFTLNLDSFLDKLEEAIPQMISEKRGRGRPKKQIESI